MNNALSLDIRPLLTGSGTLPMLIQAPEPGLDLREAFGECKPLIDAHLYRAGGILLRGFDVGGAEAFREF
ncbi:TauD/TfdA family dioxygenase, partial [Pseudomonas reactans]|nr:TauD/TfdA family dioxygenase [Pseudomonas reactans]